MHKVMVQACVFGVHMDASQQMSTKLLNKVSTTPVLTLEETPTLEEILTPTPTLEEIPIPTQEEIMLGETMLELNEIVKNTIPATTVTDKPTKEKPAIGTSKVASVKKVLLVTWNIFADNTATPVPVKEKLAACGTWKANAPSFLPCLHPSTAHGCLEICVNKLLNAFLHHPAV